MIEVERRKLVAAPVARLLEVLHNVEHLQQLVPRAERVDVQGQTENRARVAVWLRTGRFGLQRIAGEARVVPNGLRFIAVEPVQIDARWSVVERGDAPEVTVRLSIDPGGMLQSVSRFLPRRLIEQRLGHELDACLEALETLVRGWPVPGAGK